MSISKENIDVRISRRVLWVGNEAYPLNNIARVSSVQFDPDRRAAISQFIKRLVRTVAIWAVAAIVLACTGSEAQGALQVLLALAVLGWMGYCVHKLYEMLGMPTLYALSIETAGAPNTALMSPNSGLVSKLVQEITSAIDNPAAEYAMKVENFTLKGDVITTHGAGAHGKITIK